jgi:oligosaccharide repeat unit polymerase
MSAMDTSDWILLSIAFYVVVLLLTGVHALVLRRSSLFEPIGLYLFFVTLFALPLPVRAVMTMDIEGNVSPLLPQFASYLPISLALTALALPTFSIGYYSRLARSLGAWSPLLAKRSLAGTRASIWLLVAISCGLIYLLTEELGGLLPFLLLGYKSSEATFGRGYLAVGFPWLIVAMMAFLDRWSASRKTADMVMFCGLLLANVAVHVVTGNRGLLMYTAIVIVVFVHWRIRPLSLKVLAPVAVAGFIALNVLGSLRSSNYDSLDDFFTKTSTSAESVTADNDSGLFYTLTIGEFVVPFESLPLLMSKVGVTEWPWFGWSFVRAPIYLVPSFLFPDRPDSLAIWYMNTFYGGSGGLNEGRAFFFLSEGYLNFGPPGVLLVAAVWGVLWGALHQWMKRGRERFGTVLIYALVVAFMFRCISGEFVTLLVGITQQSLAAVVLILVLAGLFGGLRRRRSVARVA